MHKRHGQLGERLVQLGLITPEDIDRALNHQHTAGGYFGDALVELGLLTPDQVRWALADQYDIPFVQIHPGNIDRATAMAVPAGWAREHQILPVLRHGDTVTVVLADPAKVDRLDEVRRFTRASHVEAALSSESTLLELIEAVHGVDGGAPIRCIRWLAEVLAAGVTELGISARGDRVRAWSRRGDTSVRRLQEGWADELARMVHPFPRTDTAGPRSWPAVLSINGSAWRVECRAVGEGHTLEWAACNPVPLPGTFPCIPLDDALRTRVTEDRDSKGTLLWVIPPESVPHDAFDAMVAALPLSLLGADCRTVHVVDRPAAVPPEVLFVPSPGCLRETLCALNGYGLDAISLDVETLSPAELDVARRVASLVVVYPRSTSSEIQSADLSLGLRVSGDEPTWALYRSSDATD